MKPVTSPEPRDIDPTLEQSRTQRLQELRALYDAAVARLQAAKSRQANVQAALNQLQNEFNQAQPQLAPAQQDAAAKRSGADARRPRIAELRAAWDAVTARLLGNIETSQPLLLLPVRMETRFMRSSPEAPLELRVRIYPDDIHIDTHEPLLTKDEQRWATYFQQQMGADDVVKRRAWRQMAERFGARRAAWIARVAASGQPPSTTNRDSSWTRAPYTKLLPDRWVAVAYRCDQPVVTVWGKDIKPEGLATGPAPAVPAKAAISSDPALPAVDEGMRWMIDFQAAEDAGMALRIPLSPEQAARGFERLIVAGIRTLDATKSMQLLTELLEAQHYTRGLSLLPQNTPTNNTEEAGSGFGQGEGDVELAYQVELGQPLVGPMPAQQDDRRDGHWLAWALGLTTPAIFDHVYCAGGTEQRDARRTNKQLWPQDTPWLRRLLINSNTVNPGDFIRDHFATNVVARGPLPAIRIGNQPYGVLPVTAFERFCRRPRAAAETVFLQRLRGLQNVWRRAAAMALSVTHGSELVPLLAESGTSCRYAVQDFQNNVPQPPLEIGIADLIPKLLPGGNGPLLAETLDACSHRFDAWITSLATRRLDELRKNAATGIRLGGYGWLEDVRPSAAWQPADTPAGVNGPVFQSPANMGFVQAPSLAHATTAAILRSGYLSHLDEGDGNSFAINLSSDRVRRAEWLLAGVRQGQSLGALLGYRFERRLHENGLDQYIARFRTLAALKQNDDLANAYAQVRAKQQLYEEVNTLRDEAAQARAGATAWRAVRESRQQTRQQYQNTIDAYLSLQVQVQNAAKTTADAQADANRHRAANPLSNLHKTIITKPGVGDVEIVDRADLIEEGDVTTWSAEQTRLEGLLQQARATEAGYRTKLAEAKRGHDIAVQAAALLDDPKNPQSIPAAQSAEDQQTHLADGFDLQATSKEGQPGKAEQDLAAARLALAQAITQQWQTSLVSVAANNVVDGLELRRRWTSGRRLPSRWDATTIPFGNATLGFPAPGTADFKPLTEQLQWLDEMVDAVGDLVLAESTYHLVQGNPLRSGATLDGIAGGEIPPHEMEVIRTPRTGMGLTHRMLVLFANAHNFPTPSWPSDATRVRAAAEPALNAWVAQLLPDPSRTKCLAEFVDRVTGKTAGTVDVALTALQISPLDAIYMLHGQQGPQRGEMEERLLYFLSKTKKIPRNADVRFNYDLPATAGGFTLRQFLEIARAARALIAASRPIDGRDLAFPGETPDPGINVADLAARATAAQQSFSNALTALQAALANVRGSATANFDALANAFFQAAAFGIPGSIPALPGADAAQDRTDLLAQGDSVAKEMDARLKRIAQLAPAASGAETQRDYQVARLHEIFGSDFKVTWWVTPQNAAGLKNAFAASLSLQNNNPFESVTWFQRAAYVRDGIARLHDSLEYAEAAGTGANLALQVAQLPYHAGDLWAAISGTATPGVLSLVAYLPLPLAVTFDQPIAGLLIDEWNEMVPRAKEVTGLAFHYDQPNAAAPQAMLLAVMADNRMLWDLDSLQTTLVDTLNLAQARSFPADRRAEVAWVEGRLPRGAQMAGDQEDWRWSTHDPAPLSQFPAHTSAVISGEHQHFFYGASQPMSVAIGDSLFAYVYLDPTNPPREVMLQWNDGSWEHRAYWGENLIGWGQDGTPSRRRIGALPPPGHWVRLQVPAGLVALEGRELNGMAFTLWDGRATWDRAGRIPAQPLSVDVADERSETLWFDERIPEGASLFADSDSWQWVSRDPAPRDGSFIHQSGSAAGVHQHYFMLPAETIWIDDALPAGAVPAAEPAGESWQWVNQNPAPLFGNLAHQSALLTGEHQHFFTGAAAVHVPPGASLFAHVYLDPANPPREVMLQWNDGTWEHRAYWGENLINWGADGSASRCFMGPLPLLGQWGRLEVPARLVGLENRDLNGMSFALWDGRAAWDRAGVAPQQPVLKVVKGDVLYADVFLDPADTPGTVMLQWNDGSWEHRAYWGANSITWGVDQSPSRRPMGALPVAGQWVRLMVPASQVGLEGREVRGMAFTLSNGRASWNRAGTLCAPLIPAVVFASGVI